MRAKADSIRQVSYHGNSQIGVGKKEKTEGNFYQSVGLDSMYSFKDDGTIVIQESYAVPFPQYGLKL